MNKGGKLCEKLQKLLEETKEGEREREKNSNLLPCMHLRMQ